MRRMFWLLIVLAGCSGSDADPLDVAARFHALRIDGDDPGMHALLTGTDRAALPLEEFPAAVPPGLALKLFGWGHARLDSASVLSEGRDTAAVLLHIEGPAQDTLRLVATREPRSFLGLQRDRVRWRVSIGLAERALLDSLATGMRENAEAPDSAMIQRAHAYLEAADRHPLLARPADIEAARSTLRRAIIAEALRVELRIDETISGARFVGGQIENPTARRVATLQLIVRDAAGGEEHVDFWDIPAGGATPIWQLTRLQDGPLTYRFGRIQVY